ncbi:MAG: aminotransferase class I/II-fold pyridoxal phosphate-dependent enzyme [Rhodospirillales bacterium]|nr:aminotransferase class I/II-fold pyridoxal phosphate-dependent enzyme [Rhodospirillales bacterium]
MERVICLRSDTVTTPSPAMRKAMAEAEVGDDYYNADPTIHRLEAKAAEMLGKEAAILVLSGTMGNLTSIMAQANRGESMIVEETAHIFVNEGGGMAAVAGVMPRTLKGKNGFIEPDQLEKAIFPTSVLHPPTRLVCLENTHNVAGGRCLSIERTAALCRVAHKAGAKVHLDGARIFNAAIALRVPASALVKDVDSIQFCLSKGLGCPAGSIVAGSRELVTRVRHMRQLVGGGMRQGGVFAAAGIVGLDTMVERLEEDHANAKRLARHCADAGMPVNANDVETNMVFVELPDLPFDPPRFVRELREGGVEINPPKGRRIRFVTHYQTSAADIDKAGGIIKRVYQRNVQQGGIREAASA